MIRPRDPVVEALALRRVALGLTMRDVAKLRGIRAHPSYLSRAENGQISPTLASLRSWAEALDCDIVVVPRRNALGQGAA